MKKLLAGVGNIAISAVLLTMYPAQKYARGILSRVVLLTIAASVLFAIASIPGAVIAGLYVTCLLAVLVWAWWDRLKLFEGWSKSPTLETQQDEFLHGIELPR